MSRARALSSILLRAGSNSISAVTHTGSLLFVENALRASTPLWLKYSARSCATRVTPYYTITVPQVDGPQKFEEPPRRYRDLTDKELWHEAWMYEDKFGTEDDPILVPCTEPSRVIGVTDPDDDTLLIWGILNDGEPPRQFVEGGEFFVLKRVAQVKRVGHALLEMEEAAEQESTKIAA